MPAVLMDVGSCLDWQSLVVQNDKACAYLFSLPTFNSAFLFSITRLKYYYTFLHFTDQLKC